MHYWYNMCTTLFFLMLVSINSCIPIKNIFLSVPNAFSHAKAFGSVLQSICEENPDFLLLMQNHSFSGLNCNVKLLPAISTSIPDFGDDFPYNEKKSYRDGVMSLFAKTKQLAWEEYVYWDSTFCLHSSNNSVLVADANSFAAIAAANMHSIPVFCHTPNNMFDVSHFPSPFPYSGLTLWNFWDNFEQHWKGQRLHDIVLETIVLNTGSKADKLYQKQMDIRYTALIDIPAITYGNVYPISPIFEHCPQPSNYGSKLLISFGTLVYPLESLIDTIVSDLLALYTENSNTEITWVAPRNYFEVIQKVTAYKFIEVKQWSHIQNDLCSGNYSLYITHGGHNSVMESLYCGVPIIVIPLNFDQMDNAYRIEFNGFGIALNRNLTQGTLLKAIRKIETSYSYKKTLNEAAISLKNQPLASREAKKLFFVFLDELQSSLGLFEKMFIQLASLYKNIQRAVVVLQKLFRLIQ